MEASSLFSSEDSALWTCGGKVLFIVVYDIHEDVVHHVVTRRQMVNVVNFCNFLEHHLHPNSQDKVSTLANNEPRYSS